MATVEVEVDLDDFDTYDLVEEVINRIGSSGKRKVDDEQMELIMEEIKIYRKPSGVVDNCLPIETVDDQIKMEFLQSVWNKYTSVELEAALTK